MEKKPAKKVSKKEPASKIEMVSYSMTMVIPTGQYANIQPNIVVKGGTIEEAHKFIAPHMNRLWKEYYLVSERRPEPKKEPAPTPKVQVDAPVASPDSSAALIKATQAIDSCMSIEALEMIVSRVEASQNLTNEDKGVLAVLIGDKKTQFNDTGE